MRRSIMLGLVIAVLGSTSASAFESIHRVDKRQDRQEWRIHHGIENGSLTRREVKRLRRGARQIERLERMAMLDGHLHPAEFGMLDDALDDLSERIYEAKHNDEDRVRFGYDKRKRHHRDKAYFEPPWPGSKPYEGSYRVMAKPKQPR